VNAKTLALEQEVQEHRRTVAARDHHAERERLFSAAVESTSDAIITMSLDGTITGWNRRRSGCSDTARRKPWARTSHCSCPTTGCRRSRTRCDGSGWGESIEHSETVRLRKGGQRIEVSLSLSPIKSASGATIGFSKVARDITEANKTSQVLRRQTEELRHIFETSQDLIMVMDSRGSMVQISPSCEAILGYRPEEMIGHSGVDFIHPDHLENSRREMRAARADSARRSPIRAAFTRTGGRCGCHGSEHGPGRPSVSFSSDAT
jgi:PAS domain S-box-containing protein